MLPFFQRCKFCVFPKSQVKLPAQPLCFLTSSSLGTRARPVPACAYKDFSLQNVQPLWTALPLRTASPGSLSKSVAGLTPPGQPLQPGWSLSTPCLSRPQRLRASPVLCRGSWEGEMGQEGIALLPPAGTCFHCPCFGSPPPACWPQPWASWASWDVSVWDVCPMAASEGLQQSLCLCHSLSLHFSLQLCHWAEQSMHLVLPHPGVISASPSASAWLQHSLWSFPIPTRPSWIALWISKEEALQ